MILQNQKALFNVLDAMDKNLIGTRLHEARKGLGMNQAEVVAELAKRGCTIQIAAYSKWETGMATPNPYQFLAVCDIFHIRDIGTFFMGTGGFTSLNQTGRRKVEEYISDLEATGLYAESDAPHKSTITLRVYDLPASAGTGNFLDDSGFEMEELLVDDCEKGADFGIRVSGDSMEPRYHTGQIVCVKQQADIQPGEVGIFFYDGSSYIKMLEKSHTGKVYLESLNPAYDPIFVNSELGFSFLGKVLTK